MKGFLVFSICMMSSLSSADDSRREAYMDAFSMHVTNSTPTIVRGFEAQGFSATEASENAKNLIETATYCHVQTLDAYPDELQNIMFQAIENGGTYPDAETALKTYVGRAELEGDTELAQAFYEATARGIQCIRSSGGVTRGPKS